MEQTISNYNGYLKEKEIKSEVNLCDSKGLLNGDSIAWCRKPIINCNIHSHWPRKKKWNYWCIINKSCLFSVTLSNLDYIGMAFVYFLDLKTKKFIEETFITPFGKGIFMPDGVNEDIQYKGKQMEVSFKKESGNVAINVTSSKFGQGSLEADIEVMYPKDHETLTVVVPWSKSRFQCTSKHNCLPSKGILKVGSEIYDFKPEESFACLDFGRGVWPYHVEWNWATFSGNNKGKIVGVNLGGKWTDMTGMCENAVVVDGRLTKISENVQFIYDEEDFMKPWNIKTSISESVNLIFTPLYERIAKSDAAIIKSEVHQMVGYFNGSFTDESGERINVDNILGCSEQHKCRW